MRLIKNKRGISPVFTTILLILVVVAGMSLAFAFFTGYVTDFQLGQGSSIMEQIEIEDVWFLNNNEIKITLYNYGKVEANVTSVYINDLQVNFIKEGSSEAFIEISTGEQRVIIVTPLTPLNVNTAYNLKLVTNRGSAFEGQYVTPEG